VTRFIGAIAGYGKLSKGGESRSWGQPFRCRTQSLSTHAIVVSASAQGHTGQGVDLHLYVVGSIRGQISHTLADGFAIRLELAPAEADILQRRSIG
jgi:hypothetical protein